MKRYGAPLLLGAALFLAAAVPRGLFSAEDANRVYRVLCDGFFFSGIILFGFGGYSAINATGFFDIITYSVGSMFSPFGNGMSRKAKDLREYTRMKNETRAAKWRYMAVGAVFAGLAFVFLFLYNKS